MIYVVIAFLYLSILLYILFGGADFGAGIIELTSGGKVRTQVRTLTYKTIGPIWEANHMWLIIVIVILFVGFPAIYSILSVHLHIPLLLMLFGIIGRGTAFIFRHYDAVKDDMQQVYNFIFTYSSFITPLFLGIIAGSLLAGNIDPEAQTFSEGYIWTWINYFSFAVGLFTVSICGFLAAIYLTGETKDEAMKTVFIRKSRLFNITTVTTGGLVFIAAEIEGLKLMRELISQPVTLTALIAATLSLILLWQFLKRRSKVRIRLTAGFQITMILFAVSYLYFPDFVVTSNGDNLSLLDAAANKGPVDGLGWALIMGSLFILPALFYLIYKFQKENTRETV
ncbi:Cytochrome d ubiquinol oxidase subunit II [Fulvivirga imtechensis AK7]|uniref:Cytochrome d ubiquinol oxidase subunit II n=1 Tax=Fulvivirga imtechensis AK7 TaxID=1237149 RepID=L8JXU7_9BACT|nr:cytochrome d ubiquinol oxidase subunit II [Fulvivirga imtechensis]ELR73876.1 Cytochrome d ubiquinol oxidase subunit II [Fulvivirga imtechensis AK7]